ncbi:MAG: hypothetical protein JO090_10895 [Rhizobacter sp.]|nr:hypothetical protein [Rhizobacter sp.]
MLSWPALLLAPLVALGQQTVTYALVTPSCAQQSRTALHAVAAVALVLVLAMTAMAWRAWQGDATAPRDRARNVTTADGVGASARPRFVELIAVLVGALSALVSIALWLPIWMLSPCT